MSAVVNSIGNAVPFYPLAVPNRNYIGVDVISRRGAEISEHRVYARS